MDLAGKNARDYQGLALRSLPPGRAFPRELTTPLARLLHGFADEWALVHGRVLDLIMEMDPSTATELLGAWERNAGLDGAGLTNAQRRQQIHARLLARGGQSVAYFEDLALTVFGLTITITELPTSGLFPAEVSTAESALIEEGHRFTWQVDGSGFDAQLMAAFEAYRPAHTTIYWAS